MMNRPSLKYKPEEYKARVKAQDFAWANGKPYHDKIIDECCSDFSCCMPSMFETDATKRWEYWRNHYSDN